MMKNINSFNIWKYKNLRSYNFLTHYISLKEWLKVVPLLSGKCIDIGCGNKPMEKIIAPYVFEHIGIDYEETLHGKSKIDLFTTAYTIPVADESFDSAICSAVLEHLEEPDKAISEMHRVLKKDGIAIVSVPLFWHLHEEPEDFYRYTKYGLKYLFEKNGFEIIKLKPLSGFWVTFGQESVYYFWRFRKGGKLNPLWWMIPVIGMFIQAICYLLNKIDNSKEFTWAYLLVVKKI